MRPFDIVPDYYQDLINSKNYYEQFEGNEVKIKPVLNITSRTDFLKKAS